VPGFRAVQAAALRSGALGCSLSGAGPAIFAVAETAEAQAVGEAMQRAWTGIDTELRLCTLDRSGARVLAEEGQPCA
jgi:homoserine kinase